MAKIEKRKVNGDCFSQEQANLRGDVEATVGKGIGTTWGNVLMHCGDNAVIITGNAMYPVGKCSGLYSQKQ